MDPEKEGLDIIVIYSGSEAGFTAALAVVRAGKKAVLIEPSGHPGGMAVEGIAADDLYGNKAVTSGMAREFYGAVQKYYGQPAPWTEPNWRPNYEPHVAEAAIEQLLAAEAPRITIIRGKRLRENGTSVNTDEANRITGIYLEDGTHVRGQMFIDASIEGHLLRAAGISTVAEREGNDLYGETLNGIQAVNPERNFKVRLDPYQTPGDPRSGLIPLIQAGELGQPGEADPHIMGYCFRLCLTRNQKNHIPIEKPVSYKARPIMKALFPKVPGLLLGSAIKPWFRAGQNAPTC